ncbi:MAG: NAD-binding oxidoreductase, partial [Candidatus Puniceispirillaceae bacterium]
MRPHRLFSSKKRALHEGLYPLSKLARQPDIPALEGLYTSPLSFSRPEAPLNIVNAMADHQAMMDTIRDGHINKARAEIPDCPEERANHIKSFAYFQDASMAAIGAIPQAAWLEQPVTNPDIHRLADEIRTRQTKTLASGIDHIMADLRESVSHDQRAVGHHHTALVILVEYFRDPYEGEAGTGWLEDAQAHRACLLASENAIVISNYIRLLGFDAKAHTHTASDLCLQKLAVASGLAWNIDKANQNNDGQNNDGQNNDFRASAPFIGKRFGLAVVSTDMEMRHDLPLAPKADQPHSVLNGIGWKLGTDSAKSSFNQDPFARRDYKDSALPLEKLKRVDSPTTYMDEVNIPRVPKRTDMFARAQFGDMGRDNQKAATAGYYAIKAAPSAAQRRALGAFVLLQDGEPHCSPAIQIDPSEAADHIKAASYFLGVDAAGLSRCPDWSWYSHDARGDVLVPPHDQAISMVIDQGYETMEGASGDDWISVAQSMRAYLRFSLLGGVIARQLRNMGYLAKAHTVLDGEVLQPPLLLLSGLGEVSRIGEVILHPYLGPRLKSGVVTTNLVFDHDRPIDFGLQNFCNNCQKCARECPSGAITAGPKTMFNGYEIWKSDSQKCTSYRITTK